jgi:hypothetical protein
MHLAVNLIFLSLGLVTLAYDSDIADAQNNLPYLFSELARRRFSGRQLLGLLPLPSRTRYDAHLRSIRFWAVSMIVLAFLNSLFLLVFDLW